MSEEPKNDEANHVEGDQDELIIAYPEVVENASRWAWRDENTYPGAIVPVYEPGLKALLQYVADSQGLLVFLCREMESFPAAMRDTIIKLLNRSSTVWIEGDLVMSGLFVRADPIRNEQIEASEPDFAKGPGSPKESVSANER